LKSRLSVKVTQIKLDLFTLVSEWHHFAILELVRLESFKPDPGWIAEQLDLDVRKVRAAIERLVNLELLRIDRSGDQEVWTPHTGVLQTTTDIPSAAIRNYHAQILKQAHRSLQRDPVEEREFSSGMLVVDVEQIPGIKQKIQKFQSRLSREIPRAAALKQKLYCLSLQFFPVAHGTKEK
jgi:uncharacterized protein (TIGR02147 family)